MLNWGIIGTGSISRTFVKDLSKHAANTNKPTAVLSRSTEKAKQWIKDFDMPTTGSFTDVSKFLSSDINVANIGTSHTTHADLALQCLRNGFNALAEKPFTLNRQDHFPFCQFDLV